MTARIPSGALRWFESGFRGTPRESNPPLPPFSQAAFIAVDRELISRQEKAKDFSGATATVVMVRWDRVVVANVGDSRAVLGKAGRAVSLTAEHRPPPYGA